MRTLHGRGPDLELLAACLERAAAGTLQTVLVSGEAGIGKTSILNATLDRARERGFCVFIGHTDEIERARPFGPLAVAFGCDPRAQEPRVAELGRLLAGGPPGGSGPIAAARDPGLQFRMVDGFVDLVEAFAVRAPVVLALDDVQWADTSTLLAVRSLTRRLTLLPVVLLLALRPLPREPELERLVNGIVRDGAHELTLGPLGSDAVAGLVAELVAAKPGAELLEQVAGAAGNPLFVTELVRALAEEGAIDVVDGNAELLEVSLPPSLRLTILRRLSFLSAATLELLRVASLLGSVFSLRDVTAVAGQPASGLLPALRDAIRAGVLEERGARLAFRHDVVRAAIYEDIPLDARSALHLEAGRRLGVDGAPVVQVAEQFALGARPGDVEAVDWLHGAAREVARHAPPLGVELLERALELAAADDDRPLGLLADLVPSLLWAGRPGDAEARAREALAHRPPPDLEGPIRLGLAEALFAQDRPGDVIREVDIATRGSDLTADVRSQLLAEAANALAFTGDLETAETTATKAVAIGTPVLSEGAEMGLLVLSDLAREAGKPDEALKLARDALEFAEQRVGSRNHWPPELFAAMALRNLDRLAEAQDTVRAGYQVDERLGKVSYLPLYHYESATVFFHAGQWDDAIAQARTGLTLADEVSLSTLVSWPYGLLALIDIHRGDLDGATALVDAAARSMSPSLVLASSLLDEARGAAAPALATLADAWIAMPASEASRAPQNVRSRPRSAFRRCRRSLAGGGRGSGDGGGGRVVIRPEPRRCRSAVPRAR